MDGLRVEDDLRDLACDLRAAGDDALVKELMKALKAAVKPIVPESRRNALAFLPSRGGLARLVARHPQRVTARAGKTSATVGVVVPGKKKGTGATGANEGTVRHPVFGNRKVFINQPVRPGWFDDAAAKQSAQAEDEVVKAMDAVARRAGYR